MGRTKLRTVPSLSSFECPAGLRGGEFQPLELVLEGEINWEDKVSKKEPDKGAKNGVS